MLLRLNRVLMLPLRFLGTDAIFLQIILQNPNPNILINIRHTCRRLVAVVATCRVLARLFLFVSLPNRW